MDDTELEFLKALGITTSQFGQLPDFMVKTEHGRVRLLLRSKLEALRTFGDWVIVTISPQDFVNMQRHLAAILDDLLKKKDA